MAEITAPIINGNGTDRDALTGERKDAVRAIRAAREALVLVTINGRDYPGADDRFRLAINLRDMALRALREEENRLTQEIIDLRRRS